MIVWNTKDLTLKNEPPKTKPIKNEGNNLLLWFYGYNFIPTVLEAVLEAARQKTNAVPYQNRSTLNIGYGFYFYDIINATFNSSRLIN